ncbi:MAG: hypothetical protein AAF802_05795 [Planctomycetota bacterium]
MKHIAIATAVSLFTSGYLSAQGYTFGNSVLDAARTQDSVLTQDNARQPQPLLDAPRLINVAPTQLEAEPPLPSGEPMDLSLTPIPDASSSAPSLDSTQPRNGVAPPVISQHDASIPDPQPQPLPGSAEAKPMSNPQAGHVRPAPQGQVRYVRVKKKQTMFQKLMEMERKKNAWLKRTFLGK